MADIEVAADTDTVAVDFGIDMVGVAIGTVEVEIEQADTDTAAAEGGAFAMYYDPWERHLYTPVMLNASWFGSCCGCGHGGGGDDGDGDVKSSSNADASNGLALRLRDGPRPIEEHHRGDWDVVYLPRIPRETILERWV